MSNIDLEWEQFLETDNLDEYNEIECNRECDFDSDIDCEGDYVQERIVKNVPKASPIYISTKTKIAYLNKSIDLQTIFWLLPVQDYHTCDECIIKKQIKINSISQEELDIINDKLKNEKYVDQHIINHIDNPSGRIKFKDVRKISVGLSKKDVLSYRCKKKSAFYNCFVVILRILWENKYREIHVKVFNTGKLEIPGIQNDSILERVLEFLVELINSAIDNTDSKINYILNKNETVLVNSNFNCGFYIDREKLFNLLRYKYRINSCYDPCSYPGIQCEFYYDINLLTQTGMQPNDIIESDNSNNSEKIKSKLKKFDNKNIIKISFMVFRTGSILIVGKCNDEILYNIYEFIKKILIDEFKEISIKIADNYIKPTKKRKIRKKYITINKYN